MIRDAASTSAMPKRSLCYYYYYYYMSVYVRYTIHHVYASGYFLSSFILPLQKFDFNYNLLLFDK